MWGDSALHLSHGILFCSTLPRAKHLSSLTGGGPVPVPTPCPPHREAWAWKEGRLSSGCCSTTAVGILLVLAFLRLSPSYVKIVTLSAFHSFLFLCVFSAASSC